jgi:hypothetical protein
LHLTTAALDRVGHDRPHVPQAAQVAHGIGDGARRWDVAHRADLPAPPGHPGRPVQPDERRVPPFPGGRNQDVYEVGQVSSDVVAAQRRRTRDQAAAARVEQRGHFLLDGSRRSGQRDVDAGQHGSPRPAGTKTMPERAGSNAGG